MNDAFNTTPFYKKKNVIRITSIPSQIIFEIGMFPHNVPLPAPKTSARLLGGGMHFLHAFIRISQVQKVPDSDLGWEDMYREHEGSSWFDWVRISRASFWNHVSDYS